MAFPVEASSVEAGLHDAASYLFTCPGSLNSTRLKTSIDRQPVCEFCFEQYLHFYPKCQPLFLRKKFGTVHLLTQSSTEPGASEFYKNALLPGGERRDFKLVFLINMPAHPSRQLSTSTDCQLQQAVQQTKANCAHPAGPTWRLPRVYQIPLSLPVIF